MMSNDYILYGMQASLYTGKARAYMRRNRIPVTERGAGHPEYICLLYTSPSPRDATLSRIPSSA